MIFNLRIALYCAIIGLLVGAGVTFLFLELFYYRDVSIIVAQRDDFRRERDQAVEDGRVHKDAKELLIEEVDDAYKSYEQLKLEFESIDIRPRIVVDVARTFNFLEREIADTPTTSPISELSIKEELANVRYFVFDLERRNGQLLRAIDNQNEQILVLKNVIKSLRMAYGEQSLELDTIYKRAENAEDRVNYYDRVFTSASFLSVGPTCAFNYGYTTWKGQPTLACSAIGVNLNVLRLIAAYALR